MLQHLSTFIVFLIVLYLLVLITQIIWNTIMPDVFGLKQITFIQTLGLLVLANIFFGSHCNMSSVCTSYNN